MTIDNAAPAPRTYLFVPGDRPERFDKALASAADAVVLDLEDAVLPADKPRARAAVAAGQVLPLGTVLERLAREHPGQVLKVELESEHGRWIYEVRLLQSGGRLTKLYLDAATGETLARRDKERDRDRHGAERR